MSTIWGFDHIEKKHTLYSGKDCMKRFCDFLREHAKKIIDFKKKKLLPLTKKELKSYQDGNVYYIYGKRILKIFAKDKIYRKVRDNYHFIDTYRVAHKNVPIFLWQ